MAIASFLVTPGMTDRELIAAAIAASGLSARAYAMRVLRVNERTVRRWLADESTIRDRSLKARIVAYVRKRGTAFDAR